jgi:hypothetical protein
MMPDKTMLDKTMPDGQIYITESGESLTYYSNKMIIDSKVISYGDIILEPGAEIAVSPPRLFQKDGYLYKNLGGMLIMMPGTRVIVKCCKEYLHPYRDYGHGER